MNFKISFLDLKIKYEKEVLILKEKSRQHSYSLGGLIGTSEMDEFFKIRIKNFGSMKVIYQFY